jgi:hypothetical protein
MRSGTELVVERTARVASWVDGGRSVVDGVCECVGGLGAQMIFSFTLTVGAAHTQDAHEFAPTRGRHSAGET